MSDRQHRPGFTLKLSQKGKPWPNIQPKHPATTTRRHFLQQSTAAIATLALAPTALSAAPAETLLTTPSGKLRGEIANGVRIFRGIPFAAPPIGPLRFRPTAPLTPWKGIREATAFAPPAMQSTQPSGSTTMSEDCLYLNVWAPTGKGPYPVFVWIHGGSFTGGSSSTPISDGTLFAEQNIVHVTVAYRLGVFGFMDLSPLLGPDFADSGNNALRDLIASLQWVNQNIAAFGGDPNRVTVGGESAGAKATAALMAIPQSSKLFQSAISESGGGERVVTQAQATQVSQDFGTLWRSNHPSSIPGYNDLLTAPAADLIKTQARLVATANFHFPFRSQAGGALLPKRPVDMIAASSSGKRLLIGTNRDESASFIGPHPTSDPTGRDLGNLTLDHFDEVFDQYKTIYPGMTDAERRIRAVTAEEYWVPSIRLADANIKAGGATWMYRLDYTKPTGRYAGEAYHSLDLSLIWQQLDADEKADPAAAQLSPLMHGAWVSFITATHPPHPTSPSGPSTTPKPAPPCSSPSNPASKKTPSTANLNSGTEFSSAHG